MARPIKKGLDYFPLNVDFFDDDKLQLIFAEFGIDGEIIAVKLLCKIYKDGYCYRWGEDEALLFASKNKFELNRVNGIVKGLLKRGFFNQTLFDSHQILSSRGIQTRFLEAKVKSPHAIIPKEHLLTEVNSETTEVNSETTEVNSETSTQSKTEDSTLNNNKSEQSKPNSTPSNVFLSSVYDFLVNNTDWHAKWCENNTQKFAQLLLNKLGASASPEEYKKQLLLYISKERGEIPKKTDYLTSDGRKIPTEGSPATHKKFIESLNAEDNKLYWRVQKQIMGWYQDGYTNNGNTPNWKKKNEIVETHTGDKNISLIPEK